MRSSRSDQESCRKWEREDPRQEENVLTFCERGLFRRGRYPCSAYVASNCFEREDIVVLVVSLRVRADIRSNSRFDLSLLGQSCFAKTQELMNNVCALLCTTPCGFQVKQDVVAFLGLYDHIRR